MKPLEDRVIVIPDKEGEKVSEGGIVIPEGVMTTPHQTGTIKSVGSRVEDRIEVGAKVLYPKQAGMHVEYEDEHLLFMRYADILSIL